MEYILRPIFRQKGAHLTVREGSASGSGNKSATAKGCRAGGEISETSGFSSGRVLPVVAFSLWALPDKSEDSRIGESGEIYGKAELKGKSEKVV